MDPPWDRGGEHYFLEYVFLRFSSKGGLATTF